ncbi:hypothetical protein BaRGS_00026668, partial [Batillaria attramentaria]
MKFASPLALTDFTSFCFYPSCPTSKDTKIQRWKQKNIPPPLKNRPNILTGVAFQRSTNVNDTRINVQTGDPVKSAKSRSSLLTGVTYQRSTNLNDTRINVQTGDPVKSANSRSSLLTGVTLSTVYLSERLQLNTKAGSNRCPAMGGLKAGHHIALTREYFANRGWLSADCHGWTPEEHGNVVDTP